MRTLITGGTLVTPDEIIPDHTLVIEDQKIDALRAGNSTARPRERLIDAEGLWVAPGMIDVHIHGALGHGVMDATAEAIHTIARFSAKHGVTSYLPTTWSASPDMTAAAIENVANCAQPKDGAHHLGVHLEGPYLNPDHGGAQSPEQLRKPDPAEYAAWLATDVLRLITLAPELEGSLALVDQAVRQGIEIAIGHSGASYEQVLEAADHGARQATHVYNGMLGLHHRRPGTLGGVLTDDRISAQVIADGIHVHPAMIKLLIRAKGASGVILITDAMQGTGMADGDYEVAGQRIIVQDGIARTGAGDLSGSTLTMDAALRNMVKLTDFPLNEVLPTATSIPAEAMGLSGRKGVLAPGADADVLLLDSHLNIRLTMVCGQVVYEA